MSEKPIIFSGEMVRAILDGRKTQTRRVRKGAPKSPPKRRSHAAWVDGHCPYGQPGDRLWVRETFEYCDEDGGCESVALFYKADDGLTNKATWIDIPPDQRDAVCEHYPWDELTQRWRPSIYMPRWASRITLEITGIRVERVQDISEAGAISEGWYGERGHGVTSGHLSESEGVTVKDSTPRRWFANLWNHINAQRGYGWEANPWVWVIEFRRIKP